MRFVGKPNDLNFQGLGEEYEVPGTLSRWNSIWFPVGKGIFDFT